MKLCKGSLCSIAVACLALSSSAFGAVVTFTDRAAWEAAVSSEVTTTFDQAEAGYTPPASGSYTLIPTSGLSLDGLTFTNYDSSNPVNLYASYPTGSATHTVLKGQDYLTGYTNKYHIVFATSALAFGVDLMAAPINGATGFTTNYTVQIGASTWNAPTFASPVRAFFGLTSDTNFNAVDLIYTTNTSPTIDNFSVATPGGAAPEAATMMTCATGLVLLSRMWKRKSVAVTV